jgi:phosphatidylserine decarboxylase
MDTLFIFFQHIIPQHWLSRCAGWLAEARYPIWFKNVAIAHFIKYFKVDMTEAEEPDPAAYVNFNAFFTRPLKAGARPLADAGLVCPADGTVSQLGSIEGGRIFQAKGQYFSTLELLGGDEERSALFNNGQFVTIYLSPRDYHRVHMPVAGKLTATTYIPGKLFSVNQVTAENVERLFARNERLVCYFDTDVGPMAMILVGAMVVAGIETVWSGQEVPASRRLHTRDLVALPEPVSLVRGQEMGRFKLGSTVILLFPNESLDWEHEFVAGTATRLGAKLGEFKV